MLVALWDVSNQFNDNNGSILTNGKIYVYYSGRAALAPTWSSADGSHVNSNPIILDNNGRAVAFADDQYTYTCVVCDFYGRELFSFDPASFGTGGGGSTTEGNDAAHWIGATGTEVQVTALADTLLPLPSNPDYEGDFVSQTTYTTISMNKGLYMVDADIRIQQDDDDLENIIKDISVYTGLTGPDSLTTSQKNWTGPEASDDRHFVQVHFIRHVADEGEDLYFQMNSPVDLSSAWIDKLSIVKLTEGGNGKNYVGGYGIDITGPVISVSGMIPEASAANFVDVITYNTDIENIYETIAETSAMIPSGVATEQFVEDFTSAFITEDALNGYATQEWVQDQHYITSADIPPIPQDVVTSGELATVSGDIVSQIPSLDGYATQNWVQDQGYLTSVPEEYVTQTEMENYTSAFITSADLPSLDGYATEQYVQDYTSAFITSADVPQFTQEQADWDEDDQSAPDYIKNKPSIPSIEGLASEQYVQDYTSAFITSADIPDVPADVVTSGQLATVSGEIVNQIPDTSDMATQTWVNEQGFLTSIPDDLVTSGELATVSGDIVSQMPSQTTVSIDPTLSYGTKIAEFNINGTSGELFAPSGSGGSSDIFFATYGTTTFNEIKQAIQAGKAVFMKRDIGEFAMKWYVLPMSSFFESNNPSSSIAKFSYVEKGTVISGTEFTVNGNNTWTSNGLWNPGSGNANQYLGVSYSQYTGKYYPEWKNLPSIPAEYATSGDLVTLSGAIEADIPRYTAGDNISIVNDEISVSGTTGLIAGENISITASGDNYVISSTGGGGGGDYVPLDANSSPVNIRLGDSNGQWLLHTSGDSPNKDYILAIGYAGTGIKIGTEVGQGNLGDYQYNWSLNWQGLYAGQPDNDKKYWAIDNGGVIGWEQNGEHWHYGLEEQARLVPASTSANNDQVLTVVSGSPAWVAPAGGGSGSYTATAPIAIDDSNNISLSYGNTLVLTNSSNTDTAESNQYGNMTLAILGEPSESDNLQISSTANISVRGTAGNHLRLRIDLDDTHNYIDSKVNLLSGGQEITLDGTQKTISGFQTPDGSTWASIFDFSVHPISDMYASQATSGEVLVELWEYNGDTPVLLWYGYGGMDWPEGTTIDFTSSSSKLNVANPMPAPGYANYVLTSNGYGGSYWAPAQGGTSYNGTYPIQVAYNSISLAHDSTLSTKQSAVIVADGEEDGYGRLGFMPLAATPSVSDPCQIQGSSNVYVAGTADHTVRLRFFDPDGYAYIDMISDLVDDLGNPIMLSGGPDSIPIRTNESTWEYLFDFSGHTIQELWDLFPTLQLWEYELDTPVRALITTDWARGYTINFNSTATTFGVTDPLPASTSSDNGKVLTVVSGEPSWVTPSGGGGSVTFPLEVSGTTRVYEAVDTSYSAYLNSHSFGIANQAPAGGEPDDSSTTIEAGQIVTTYYDGSSHKSVSVYADRIELFVDDPDYGGYSSVDIPSIANWNSAYNAVNSSATYWNSSIFSDQITSAALVNSLPADASAHPNYLYLIPEA